MKKFKKDNLRELACERLKELTEVETQCNEILATSPPGHVRIQRSGKGYQYYLRTNPKDTEGIYIKKKDQSIIHPILQRDYLSSILSEINAEKTALQKFISKYNSQKLIDIYESLPCQKKLYISPLIESDDEYASKWAEYRYTKMDFKDSQTLYTSNGLKVRSKSEVMIAEALTRHSIPFRYEFPLNLKGLGTVHPDFYCLNVRLRQEIPWEHFGMMNDTNYANKSTYKIEKYELNGFMPGINFIFTMETSEHPLDARLIERNIEKYLL